MSKRLIIANLLIVAIGLTSLPISHAQESPQRSSVKVSEYQDDPFVAEQYIGRVDASRFTADDNGRPFMSSDRVSMINESKIYRKTPQGEFVEFAWNPWPQEGRSNDKGNFRFPDEPRFPLHEPERDADGKIVMRDGLQVWKPNDHHLGINTAFATSNAVRDATEFWAGRDIAWGVNNLLEIESQVFIDFNAFFSPSARQLFFGVVPYRLKGETEIKMFETASSRDMAAHESGHAVQYVLKPNAIQFDQGWDFWGESFGDQMAMWSSLRDSKRVRDVLAESSGNLYTSNSLSRIGEAFAALIGTGTGIRDAFNDNKVSTTSDEEHERSSVLTGAAYTVFTQIYNKLRSENGLDEHKALAQAGDIMGTFLVLSTDYTPENSMTLEDVCKAYLKVDKEIFNSRYQSLFASEFIRRELFDANSVQDWMAHEAAIPDLRLPRRVKDRKLDNLIQASLDELGIGPDFGLKLQSVTRDNVSGQTMVRVQLTDGRGSDAPLLNNHGILTFRANGTLADYHPPLPSDEESQMRAQLSVHAKALVHQARQFGLDDRGGLLSIVRGRDGQLSVEARVMRTQGLNCWAEVFSLSHPEGERRNVIVPTIPGNLSGMQPNGVRILSAEDINQ
ncbi:MAG TPA: hypothetical protein VFB82_01170 [Blastocatellia bacterium]|nr:hypothetical protein [Blastocatellia bacterium]